MTPEEQQQVNAMRAYYERQCGNLATEGANVAAALEGMAMRLKAAQEEIAALKEASAPKMDSNVVPITEPAA